MKTVHGKDYSRRRRFLFILPVAFAGYYSANSVPPVLTNITFTAGAPQLTILSAIGATNQIQSTTNLAQPNWAPLTSLVVTQSPYSFTDTITPPGPQRFYRVLESDAANSAPPGMVPIPAGTFEMGDTFYEGFTWEVPVHSVTVSPYYLDKFEVTKALWDQVISWSLTNGYSYDNPGSGKAPNHPVQSIDWFDMVKWCNARCEMEGRLPCYYTDAALTQVYRSGQVNPSVNWSGGYRLPTEAEWERAARGGASGHRFPWTDVDTITHSRANYYSDPSRDAYDVSPTTGFNPAFVDGVLPYTAPVGSFAPNAYGLYDMSGNIWEWCWDWAGNYPSSPVIDPRGPDTGSTRVGRGGNWDYYSEHCRDAYRFGDDPTTMATNRGFRCAMNR